MKNKSIGGYFSLELNNNIVQSQISDDYIKLNSGRNCLKYILLSKGYSKVYIPYFTCEAVLEPIIELGIDYEFYDIDDNLEPIFNFDVVQEKQSFLYTNYFGIKDLYIKILAGRVNNLIVDNAQAFFSEAIKNIDTFYSPRKFIGIPDGGILSTNKKISNSFVTDVSFNRVSHLLKRIDLSPEDGYDDFKINDASLDYQPIKLMSNLTRKLLNTTDFENIKNKRKQNFRFLDTKLSNLNLLPIKINERSIPMIYPFRTKNSDLKKKLLDNKIYCATYWPNVFKWCNSEHNSYHLTNEIIPLPIDQRYSKTEMKIIVDLVI